MTNRLPDRWVNQDYPVLIEVVYLATTRPDRWASIEHLNDALAGRVTPEDIQDSLQRLSSAGFFKATATFGGIVNATAPSERALRMTGVWPDREHITEDVLRVVEEQAANAPEADRHRWQRVRDTFADAGQDITAKVIAEIVARQAGL
jgi:hypothetical protein